jgi:hypothetical protein
MMMNGGDDEHFAALRAGCASQVKLISEQKAGKQKLF